MVLVFQVFEAAAPGKEPTIIGRHPYMLHLLHKPPAPDVEPAPSAVSSERHASAPVLITEQQVLFMSAAAISVPPATTHRHWPGAAFITAIGHVRIRLPEPRRIDQRREASYFEAGRMSRLMEHL
jgi:hypothetical protein